MLSVYTRHSQDCKHVNDKLWHRCHCPKWIWGSHQGEFVRTSARTRLWDEAERLRHRMESPDTAPPEPESLPPTAPLPAAVALLPTPTTPPFGLAQKPRVRIEAAVEAYLADAISRELAAATISKLETIFRKQFLVWCGIAGLEYIDQIDLDALLNFRNTWKDGRLAKQKKQSRLIGFFWACVRRDYIVKNPSMGLGKIKVVQIPTDYFPRDEFKAIIDATYRYGDPRGGGIPVEHTRTRLRTLTLLCVGADSVSGMPSPWNATVCTATVSCSTRPRPERLFTFRYRLLWWRLCIACHPARSPTPAISSGVATACLRARLPTGNAAIAASLSWPILPAPMALASTATRTCSAIRSRSRCCSPAFPSTRSRCCSAMRQSKSPRRAIPRL